jgi:hypothetical protein
VAAGEHVVLFVNHALGLSQSRRVRIQAGETTSLNLRLSAQ